MTFLYTIYSERRIRWRGGGGRWSQSYFFFNIALKVNLFCVWKVVKCQYKKDCSIAECVFPPYDESCWSWFHFCNAEFLPLIACKTMQEMNVINSTGNTSWHISPSLSDRYCLGTKVKRLNCYLGCAFISCLCLVLCLVWSREKWINGIGPFLFHDWKSMHKCMAECWCKVLMQNTCLIHKFLCLFCHGCEMCCYNPLPPPPPPCPRKESKQNSKVWHPFTRGRMAAW